ncbi:ArsA family ATPase [Nocardioides bruguierae]|uniref:ArsA family ATPase n=1 Tax=Nocardioides bruguierae TaxID=2945102 RepID=UPI00202060BC|nr:ArsA family ATPase [Nocardioides bruguierae]MCL8024869.1 ArsA family ATPase [Nocardioides bruguierae]
MAGARRPAASSPAVLLVVGKGGVGKTSLACASALARARAGARVLLVSTDPAHNLGHAWGAELGDEPRRVADCGAGHVDAVEIDPAATVDAHLAAVRGRLRRLLPERMHGPADRHLEQARHAPGTHEAAVLERLADVVTSGLRTHDAVVVDTAPTGHTLRLMALPERLTTWTESLLANRDRSERFGAALRGLGGGDRATDPTADRDAELRRVLLRRRDRLAGLRDVLVDPARCGARLVLTAERLPVAETLALHAELGELGIAVDSVVVNRRSPDDGAVLRARRQAEERWLGELLAGLGPAAASVHEVPLLPDDLVGESGLGLLADLLPDLLPDPLPDAGATGRAPARPGSDH